MNRMLACENRWIFRLLLCAAEKAESNWWKIRLFSQANRMPMAHLTGVITCTYSSLVTDLNKRVCQRLHSSCWSLRTAR